MSTTQTLPLPSTAAATQRPRKPFLTPARVGVYAFLISVSLFFLLPLYVMLVTSLKTATEVHQGTMFAWPAIAQFGNWVEAWSTACISIACNGIQVGFWNSVRIVVPTTIVSVLLGALNGYALSFWRNKWGDLLFGIILLGAFVPFQIIYSLASCGTGGNLAVQGEGGDGWRRWCL